MDQSLRFFQESSTTTRLERLDKSGDHNSDSPVSVLSSGSVCQFPFMIYCSVRSRFSFALLGHHHF